MVKLSDYIFQRLSDIHHVDTVFLVTGGGAMHLNDSVGKCSKIKYICNHHEQACAMAAEGYSRVTNKIGVSLVTTGPGGFNTLTGVLGQWTDSIPALYISGQVKYNTTIASCPDLSLRQLGDQEGNIVDVVKPVTKYAILLKRAEDVKYELDKAIYIATHGRPGPVWIDIPLDIQASMICEEELRSFDPQEVLCMPNNGEILQKTELLMKKLKEATRPVFYVGNGVRLSGAVSLFRALIEKLGIPVVTAISGHDLLEFDHPLFFGKPGICGDRMGNVMVQSADLLIVLGTRLGIRQIGYAYDNFAPEAYKVMIDVDVAELNKPTLSIDLKIESDVHAFLDNLLNKFEGVQFPDYGKWIEWGRGVQALLPDIIEDNEINSGYVNSFVFARELFNQLEEEDVVCTGNGTAYTSTFQAMNVKRGMRVFANQGCASMGYDLPAAIGACIGNNNKPVVLITGDGSIQMNIQELQTIKTYDLPVKIFVLENEGYLAIKTTQAAFFDKHYVGSNPDSGVICANMERIAYAYDIPFTRITENGSSLVSGIKEVLSRDGACICEVVLHPEQTLFPKAASEMDENGKMMSHPLEKMFPFLPRPIQEKCKYNQ